MHIIFLFIHLCGLSTGEYSKHFVHCVQWQSMLFSNLHKHLKHCVELRWFVGDIDSQMMVAMMCCLLCIKWRIGFWLGYLFIYSDLDMSWLIFVVQQIWCSLFRVCEVSEIYAQIVTIYRSTTQPYALFYPITFKWICELVIVLIPHHFHKHNEMCDVLQTFWIMNDWIDRRRSESNILCGASHIFEINIQ